MSEYTYTDRDGDRLTIEPCGERAETACLTTTSGAHVPAADLPKIVAELYKAAGQELPIILDRPRAEDLRAQGWIDRNQVNTAANRIIGSVAPSMARGLAACLAGAADLADAEPDPEQVEDIVELIYQSGAIDGSEWAAARAAKIARAILAAGYARTEGKA